MILAKHYRLRLLAGALLLASPAAAVAQADASVMDPAAINAAQRMRAFLHGLKSFEVRADATVEDPIDEDTKIEVGNHVRYDYAAPDRLFASWQSDQQSRRLYYDGRRLTLVAPIVGYYATTEMSGSVADVLQRASERYGIVFPLPDLFMWAWSTDPAQGVTRARYIGPEIIAGTQTDHYLYRQGDVDWQVWIQRGDSPYPRKIVVTDRSDLTRPSYSARLQWNPNPAFSPDYFAFKAPPGAGKIELVSLAQEQQ